MNRTLVFLLASTATAFAQSDPQAMQFMLGEIRQLRQDIQAAAATIQRVQIVMYRVQAQSNVLSRAADRLEQARAGCRGAEQNRQNVEDQLQQAETFRRSSNGTSADERVTLFKKLSGEAIAAEQQCRVEQAEAENQVRVEESKMADLQTQLDNLDRTLAVIGRK